MSEAQLAIDFDPKLLERELPIARIHADPFQPRVDADDELKESIRSEGVLQAITVEPAQILDAICPDCGKTFAEIAAAGDYMIQDGERRYRGSIAAGKKTILAKIVEPMEEGRRLVRQVTANLHKPLTPIEEAFAFKRIIETEGLSQAELARKLGKPRSVVGDRVRLVELHPAWLERIQRGKLQVSHAPELYKFAAVPAQYQEQAVKEFDERYEYKEGDVSVEDFEQDVFSFFTEHLVELSKVSPQYKGPTVEIKDCVGKRKYAADPELWKPILSDKEKRAKQRAKEERKAAGPKRSGAPRNPEDKWIKNLPPEVQRRSESGCDIQLKTGETLVYAGGWKSGRNESVTFDPKIFQEKVDPSKLILVTRAQSYYSTGLVTTDIEALRAATAEFEKRLKGKVATQIEAFEKKSKAVKQLTLSGSAAPAILDLFADSHRNEEVETAAKILGLKLHEKQSEPEDAASRILGLLATAAKEKIRLPDTRAIRSALQNSLSSVAVRITGNKGAAGARTAEEAADIGALDAGELE